MKTYQETIEYIYSYITDRKHLKTDPKSALARPKYLLKLLDYPQDKIPVIHIAGTSGKGSTAYLINLLLRVQGFKVGLSISPHIIDIRERCQINNKLISKQEFTQIFREVIPAIEKTNFSKWGKASYFDIMIAFAFYLFWKKKIDFAVIETGLGGLFDSTNIVNNKLKICIITKIGLDHQWYLGDSYAEVAVQKAGIIQKGNNVVTINQKQSVLDVFYKRVKEKNAKLYLIEKGINFQNVKIDQSKTQFDFHFQNLNLPHVKLGLIGYHQAENAAQALAALSIASKQYQFRVKRNQIYKFLPNAFFPGRFEIIQGDKRLIIIDGAHNPQKMKTFVQSLIKLYPKNKFDFLIAFSSSKNQIAIMEGMFKQIIKYARHIFLTSFVLVKQDNFHTAVNSKRLIRALNKFNFRNYTYQKDNISLFKKLSREKGNPLVITGSLYLISSLYKYIEKLKSDLV